MTTWDDLEKKYGAAAQSAPPLDTGWDALERKYAPPAGSDQPASTGNAKSEKSPAGLLDRVNAFATGVNRGTITRTLGLPVDTIQNIVDLGKAGVGSVATFAGRPDLAPNVNSDRTQVIGSGDWLEKKARDGGIGMLFEPTRPDDPASRVLHGAGMGVGGAVTGAKAFKAMPTPQPNFNPMTLRAEMANAGMGGSSGFAGTLAGEFGASPELSILASLLPQSAVSASAGATRLAARGGEQGRRNMEQRVQDFKNAGVEAPSVGLASGNSLIQGIENLFANTPGAVGVMQRARENLVNGLTGKAAQTRDAAATDFGADVAGRKIQSDLKTLLKERINDKYGLLNDKVERIVGSDRVVSVPETLQRAEQLATPMKGAEATSSQLINHRIAQIAENLSADVYGSAPVVRMGGGNQNPTLNAAVEPATPHPTVNASLWNAPPSAPPQTVANPSLWNAPATPVMPMQQRDITVVRPGNAPLNASLWNTHKEQGIPFGALKGLRTSIGEEAASNAIVGTPEQSQFKRLYGAMSEDMRQAVNAVDRTNAGVPVGPLMRSQQPGAVALNRANDYYSAGMGRVDRVQPFANRDAPEQAYTSLIQSGKENVSTLRAVKKSIGEDARATTAATYIDRLGRANPGNQNDLGDVWSPDKFLTNWNTLHPTARKEVFSGFPGSEKVASSMDDIAKAASMLKDSSKIWANPSGSGANIAARVAMGSTAFGAFFEPMVAGTVAGGMLLANGGARLMTNPKFVTWLSQSTKMPDSRAAAHLNRLAATAGMTNDAQFKQDVGDYIDLVKNGDNKGNQDENRAAN